MLASSTSTGVFTQSGKNKLQALQQKLQSLDNNTDEADNQNYTDKTARDAKTEYAQLMLNSALYIVEQLLLNTESAIKALLKTDHLAILDGGRGTYAPIVFNQLSFHIAEALHDFFEANNEDNKNCFSINIDLEKSNKTQRVTAWLGKTTIEKTLASLMINVKFNIDLYKAVQQRKKAEEIKRGNPARKINMEITNLMDSATVLLAVKGNKKISNKGLNEVIVQINSLLKTKIDAEQNTLSAILKDHLETLDFTCNEDATELELFNRITVNDILNVYQTLSQQYAKELEALNIPHLSILDIESRLSFSKTQHNDRPLVVFAQPSKAEFIGHYSFMLNHLFLQEKHHLLPLLENGSELNGFTAYFRQQYSDEKATSILQQFDKFCTELETAIVTYKRGDHLKNNLFNTTPNKDKVKLCEKLLTEIEAAKKDGYTIKYNENYSEIKPLLIANKCFMLFKKLLCLIEEHAEIVGSNRRVSFGKFSPLLTEQCFKALTLLNQCNISNDPFIWLELEEDFQLPKYTFSNLKKDDTEEQKTTGHQGPPNGCTIA